MKFGRHIRNFFAFLINVLDTLNPTWVYYTLVASSYLTSQDGRDSEAETRVSPRRIREFRLNLAGGRGIVW